MISSVNNHFWIMFKSSDALRPVFHWAEAAALTQRQSRGAGSGEQHVFSLVLNIYQRFLINVFRKNPRRMERRLSVLQVKLHLGDPVRVIRYERYPVTLGNPVNWCIMVPHLSDLCVQEL